MKKTAFSYEDAMAELRQIVQQLQQGQVNMDQLAQQARRAAELIRQCQEHLRRIEEEVDALFPDV